MFHGDIDAETAAGLVELRSRIAASDIPSSKLDETINIASWNVREFGRRPRKSKSLHYIAEIIGQFDLVGIVELRRDVAQLTEVMRYLGPFWEVIYSDFIEDDGGNEERVAYLYDTRACAFTGLAGNASEPRSKTGTEYLPPESWWRKPFMASFRAGSFDFIALMTHVRWGTTVKGREKELGMLADYILARTMDASAVDKDMIVMGDFNIPSLASAAFKAVTARGLRMPAALAGVHGSNLAKDKRYDQILHNPVFTKSFSDFGGVLDFFGTGWGALYPEATTKAASDAMTFELSDHLPLWIQVNTDIADEQLDQILNPKPTLRMPAHPT